MAPQGRAGKTSESTIKHFSAIPWVAKRLSDPGFHLVSLSRTLLPGNGHSLMADTWNTDNTIRELLSMYRPPNEAASVRGEIRRFYTFGNGMNAHANLLHGGVIAALLDSTMGNVVGRQMTTSAPTFTVQLDITYKKPVSTPGTTMSRAWITKVEGRKIWVHGQIEDGNGELHATAEGMWLTAKAKI